METEITETTAEETTPSTIKEKSRSKKGDFLEHLRAHSSEVAFLFTKAEKIENAEQQFCEDIAEELAAAGSAEAFKKVTVTEKTFSLILAAWISLYGSEDGCDRHSMEVWRLGSGGESGRYIVFWPPHLVDQAPNDQTAYFRGLSNRLIEALRADGASVQYTMPTAKQESYEIMIGNERKAFMAEPERKDLGDFFDRLHELAIDWAASRPDLPPLTIKQLRLAEDRTPDKSDREFFSDLLAKRLAI
jgi:hypothetical protein